MNLIKQILLQLKFYIDVRKKNTKEKQFSFRIFTAMAGSKGGNLPPQI